MWEPPEVSREIVRYFVGSREVAPETGRLHWQCYAEFYEKCSTKKLQRLFKCPFAHTEIARGSGLDNEAYCSKDPLYEVVTWGTSASKAGFRSDLAAVGESVRAGFSELQVWRAHPDQYIKYTRGIQAAIDLEDEDNIPERRKVEVIVNWGATGAGKTSEFWETYGEGENRRKLFVVPLSEKGAGWMDKYRGQPYILLDEFTGQIPVTEWLKMVDMYPFNCECRGRAPRWGRWTKVLITSQLPPEQWCAFTTPACLFTAQVEGLPFARGYGGRSPPPDEGPPVRGTRPCGCGGGGAVMFLHLGAHLESHGVPLIIVDLAGAQLAVQCLRCRAVWS